MGVNRTLIPVNHAGLFDDNSTIYSPSHSKASFMQINIPLRTIGNSTVETGARNTTDALSAFSNSLFVRTIKKTRR